MQHFASINRHVLAGIVCEGPARPAGYLSRAFQAVLAASRMVTCWVAFTVREGKEAVLGEAGGGRQRRSPTGGLGSRSQLYASERPARAGKVPAGGWMDLDGHFTGEGYTQKRR